MIFGCGGPPAANVRPLLLPDSLAGLSLAGLREDYHQRLFDQYFPFWLKGGYDSTLGGFICNLETDGSPVDDEKNLWFQGRGVWVYSFLYNNFGGDPAYLVLAEKTRNFMLEHMYAGEGRWYERVHRDGSLLEGVAGNVYGALFTASGLVEYYQAAGRKEDLELAKETLQAALKAYDDPEYEGQFMPKGMPVRGVRAQGHSMVILCLLTRLLTVDPDPELERLAGEQLELIMNRFYNPEYGISNEYLAHDYSRIPGYEDQMFPGHSIEVLWMVMFEALRIKDRAVFDTAAARLRRYLELSWDNIFGGLASGNYFVFGTAERIQGTDYKEKTMWLQCEALVGCLTVLEYTGAPWAAEWYEKVRAYTLRTVANNNIGVWDQAADRRGKSVTRAEYHPKRRCNFHQPRCLMLNLLSLERMIGNQGKLTPFPQ